MTETKECVAGRELDAEVAKLLNVVSWPEMEILWVDGFNSGGAWQDPVIRWCPGDDVHEEVPRYSTDGGTSLATLREYCNKKGWWIEIHIPGGKRSEGDKIEVCLFKDFWESDRPDIVRIGDSLLIAICRAIIAAHSEDQK